MSTEHFDRAKSKLHNGTHNEVARAQAEATLALAYEQRTANLIAFEQGQWQAWRRDELTEDGVALWKRAAEQVTERLGL